MVYTVTKFGVKLPQKARYPKCPTCGEPRTKHEFRNSNKDLRRNVICWLCRRENPEAVQNYWAGIKEFEKRKSLDRDFLRRIYDRLAQHFEKRSRRRKEVMNLAAVEAQSALYLKFPERVAAIIGKTYAVRGDDFTTEDDVALAMIRDLLDELNPKLIEKNKNKRLSK